MKNTEAVVFDVDGTLLDTRELIRVGYVKTLEAHGYSQIAAEFELHKLSKPVPESYKALLGPETADGTVRELVAYHEQVQDDSVHVITAYEGLDTLLTGLHGDGLARGIFTSGTRRHLDRNFGAIGMKVDDYFEGMVTADDPIPRKPAPDGVRLILQRLGDIQPERSALAGDHAADMQAAKAAGVRLRIGVSHGLNDAAWLHKAGATHVVDNLLKIPDIID